MEDAAVAAAGVRTYLRFLLYDGDLPSGKAPRKLPRDGNAENPAADDEEVGPFRQRTVRRRGAGFHLDQTVAPWGWQQRGINLDGQMIGERLGTVCANPFDHRPQPRVERNRSLVAEDTPRL